MWQPLGASVAGSSHLRTGQPCQDYHAFHIEDNYCYCGIADGLGTAPHSDVGARIAVDAGILSLRTLINAPQEISIARWREFALSAFIAAREALFEEADRRQIAPRELATTLLLAVVSPKFFACVHIGDGAAVVKCSKGVIVASPPERLDFANETTPVTADAFASSLRSMVLPEPISALALLTDGLQNLAISAKDNAPYQPFFVPFFEGIAGIDDIGAATKQLVEFLNSASVLARTDDDKTLLVVGRQEVDGQI